MSKFQDLPELPEETAEELRAIRENIGDLTADQRKQFEEYQKFLSKTYVMPDYITPALDKAAKGLDYAGGALVRGPVGMALGAVSPEEYKKALKFEKPFPSSSEIMRRKGVPEGMLLSEVAPSIFEDPANANEDRWYVPNKEGDFDPSVRGTVGSVLDMAADPLTYATFGTSAAGKAIARQSALAAEKGHLGRTFMERVKDAVQTLKSAPSAISRPIGNAIEYAGAKTYKAGLRDLDQASVAMGNLPISDRLMKANVYGGAGSIYDEIAKKSSALTKERQAISNNLDQLDPIRLELQPRVEVWGKKGSAPSVKSPPADIVYGGPPAVKEKVGALAQTIELPQNLSPEEYVLIAKQNPWYKLKGGVNMENSMDKAIDALHAMDQVPAHAPVRNAMEDAIANHLNLGRVSYSKAGQIKSSLYDYLPNDAYSVAAFSNPGTRVRKGMARGMKEAQEGAASVVDASLAKKLGDVNTELGDYLTVRDKAAALAGRAPETVTPHEAVYAMSGGLVSPYTQTRAFFDLMGLRPLTTTTGFALNKIGKTPLTAPVDAYARRAFIDSRRSPWSLNSEEQK